MIFHQHIPPNTKMPLKTKISLVIWIIVALSMLFVFTFTIFIVALMAGVVIIALNLFRKNKRPIPDTSSPQTRTYHAPRSRDDDVIDI